MNANELSDKLLKNNLVSWGKCTPEEHDMSVWTNEQAATMLRQQQAEIGVLKDSSYEKGFIDGMAKMTESAVHRAVKGMAVKELTDVEISLIAEEFTGADGLDVVDFGRAILRKAQEK